MNGLVNIDLLTVGIAMAANLLIGFAAIYSNRNNATNRLFFFQTLILTIWSTVNYISYQSHEPLITLYLVRLVLFFAVPNSIIFLLFTYTFPKEKIGMSSFVLTLIIVITITTMVLTLTPLVFKQVLINESGAPTPVPGPGILIFILVSILSVPLGIFYLIKNYVQARGNEKKQFPPILIGVVFMFFAIVVFNFIFPAFLHNSKFIPLSALFTFPFVAFTAYAIYKHKLFNIRDVITLLVALALTIVTFVEIIFADTLPLIIFRVSVFIIVLIFSVRMVRDMFRLEFANDRLKELDQAKSEFISLATHQIRSPLTAIKGYISLILEGDYGPVSDQVKDALNTVFQSSNNLVTIVGDFLDVSRIELGRMRYEYSDFDLKQLAETVVNEYKPNIEKKGLKLEFNVQPGNYLVHADQGKIKQVIGNVIDNSIKYTPQGGMSITVSQESGTARIKIADTGVGINPKTLPLLFQKFTRADNANQVNILGTGLGLYIARQMIEAQGGKIWAESEGEGKGSQFYITIPIK